MWNKLDCGCGWTVVVVGLWLWLDCGCSWTVIVVGLAVSGSVPCGPIVKMLSPRAGRCRYCQYLPWDFQMLPANPNQLFHSRAQAHKLIRFIYFPHTRKMFFTFQVFSCALFRSLDDGFRGGSFFTVKKTCTAFPPPNYGLCTTILLDVAKILVLEGTVRPD